MEIIDLYYNKYGENASETVRQVGISQSMVSRWVKDKSIIEAFSGKKMSQIKPKSGSSQEDDDDTVDAEYETIDEVIRISGEIGNARQEKIDAAIFDSIESVVSAEFTIEIENDIFTL